MVEFALILPAAGSSTRFGRGRNKLFELLDGIPVIVRSMTAFLARGDCTRVVIPTSNVVELQDLLKEHLGQHAGQVGSRICVCQGGSNRAESVRLGLQQVDPTMKWVAVHDAARPLVPDELIERTLRLAAEHDAAVVPAMPVNLTIKQARGPLPATVMRTVPRHELWAMQTPQVIRRADLVEAFERCPHPLQQITDDAQLLELIGRKVWLIDGDERNMKITTGNDLLLAGMLLRNQH